MATQKQVIITIDDCGLPTLEGRGFTGNECIGKMKPFEDGLTDASDRKIKPNGNTLAVNNTNANVNHAS